MNSENFYFSNASKTDLGKKLSRLYLIGNISKEEYTDKIRNIADKMKADDAYIESLNIESLKFNRDACIDLFENVDASDIAGRTRNYDLLDKIIAYYERFDIAPNHAINRQDLGYVEYGCYIASSLISKEEVKKPDSWYDNIFIPEWVGYAVAVIGGVVVAIGLVVIESCLKFP